MTYHDALHAGGLLSRLGIQLGSSSIDDGAFEFPILEMPAAFAI